MLLRLRRALHGNVVWLVWLRLRRRHLWIWLLRQLSGQLGRGRLRRRDRMARRRRRRRRSLRRVLHGEGCRARRPPLIVDIRLHLVRLWLWLGLGLLLGIGIRGMNRSHDVRHVGWHAMRILRAEDGLLRHVTIPVHWSLGRPRRPDRLGNHGWAHAMDVVPRRRPRGHLRLRGVSPRPKDAVLDRGRAGRGVMPHDGKLGLGLELRRKHVRIHALSPGRGSVLVVFIVVVVGGSVGIEIRRRPVLIGFSVLLRSRPVSK
jgi:hypothetical protein